MSAIRRLQAASPYAVVFAAGVFLYNSANHFEFEQTPGRIGPDAWPKIVLALMMAIALWGGIAALLRRPAPASAETPAEVDEEMVRPPEVHPHLVWLGIAATLAYVFLLPIVGFFIATIFYVGAIIYVGQYRRWSHVIAISLILPFVFMFMFMRIVYVALPLGVAPFDRVTLVVMSLIGVR